MWTIRYLLTVIIITAIALAAGAVLWNSEDQQVITAGPSEGWFIGPDDAPVVIKAFSDFT